MVGNTEVSLDWLRYFCMITGRDMHTATLLPDGTVLIAGGITIWGGPPQITSTAEIYSP